MIVDPIVVGYDDSPPARAALRWAAREASLTGATVLVAYAVSPAWEWTLAAFMIDTDRIRRQRTRALRGPWTHLLRALSIPYQTRVLSGRPGPALLRVASSTHASCIVIGADRHRRLGHWSEGHVHRFVERNARRPVISVPVRDITLRGDDRIAGPNAGVPRTANGRRPPPGEPPDLPSFTPFGPVALVD